MNRKSALLILIGMACIGIGLAGAARRAMPVVETRQPGALVIRDVRVFDGEQAIERTSVFVADGRIVQVAPGLTIPPGASVVDGSGRTLLPGFIDAHTHAFGDALERALVFGVTTELDMFTDHRAAAAWRTEQRTPSGASVRADIFSAGTLVTAPKGHGTEYGMPIPTLTGAAEAAAFVDARIAEGSDYIKIVYDDGSAYGTTIPTVAGDALRAVITAARQRGKLAVVHIGARRAAEDAIAAGASGLVHLFGDDAPASDFASRVRASGAFVIPTLSVIESVSGVAGGRALADAQAFAPFLTTAEKHALAATFPPRPGRMVDVRHALEATRRLHAAGVPILAGSDAPNPGTVHGATLHRELELLVRAGLDARAALAAATAVPARAFGLADRGRIAPGLRADLVLVSGDPARDITATRAIEAVWKGGVRLERRHAPAAASETAAVGSGSISTFDHSAEPVAEFGAGWQISTDSLMGGASTAAMRITNPGHGASVGALEITGVIAAGAPYPWAGAMFFPAATPMAPVNLSRFTEIVFRARGDGREYQVMVFAERLGRIPATRPFTASPDWREVVMPLASFSNIDGSDIRGILFSAATPPGAFRFAIDDVRLR